MLSRLFFFFLFFWKAGRKGGGSIIISCVIYPSREIEKHTMMYFSFFSWNGPYHSFFIFFPFSSSLFSTKNKEKKMYNFHDQRKTIFFLKKGTKQPSSCLSPFVFVCLFVWVFYLKKIFLKEKLTDRIHNLREKKRRRIGEGGGGVYVCMYGFIGRSKESMWKAKMRNYESVKTLGI